MSTIRNPSSTHSDNASDAHSTQHPLVAIDFLTLMALAAMWGISFIFMRVIAPAIGWAWAADLRVAIGGALIAGIMLWQHEPLHLRRDARHFAFLGLINSAVPFALFAVAALYVPAAYSAIGNATAPLWAGFIGTVFLADKLSLRKCLGLALGISGVAVTAGAGSIAMNHLAVLAFAGTVFAALLYAIAGVYMKTQAKHIAPLALGCGSQLAAALWLLPTLAFFTPESVQLTPKLLACVLGSGLISTGLPYVLYFPLMRRIGITRALTVTFLVPCFAIFWAWLFLHEAVSLGSILGITMVLLGVFLTLGMRVKPDTDAPQRVT
jgi:drug/metabolite transporter (DMT)-like permease